jgi:clathrin heavy chain
MDYIQRLDNYDGLQLAEIALEEKYGLHDEALTIYKKFHEHVLAVKVLLHHKQDFVQADIYAQKTNTPEVWSELGKSYLDQMQPVPSIDAFIKANDATMYNAVINIAGNQQQHEKLVEYLLMARKLKKEQVIDSELVVSLAKCGPNKLADLENFINEQNMADMQKCGERCLDDKLYEAAKLLFIRTGNNQKLAEALVWLKEYHAAYEAAKKADFPKVWKAVCFACVRAQ